MSRIISEIDKQQGYEVHRSVLDGDEASDHTVKRMMDLGHQIRPDNMVVVGVAAVFYYEYADGRDGGAYMMSTGIGNLNEQFADAGTKELIRHCAKVFGRRPK